ncbi:hypothetical protein DPMN_107894 [Dreissena polymorpha]|uniref:Uncharacterized protein n=1 Tax=Dreissena polymorpha TaxID=45954 RepID=A0A9D4K7U4_DREPO|nr:hypothetical protein DPMN_107894 [Dreissena polymorpha]
MSKYIRELLLRVTICTSILPVVSRTRFNAGLANQHHICQPSFNFINRLRLYETGNASSFQLKPNITGLCSLLANTGSASSIQTVFIRPY